MIRKVYDIGKSIINKQGNNIDSLLYDENKILSKKEDEENLIIKTIFDLDNNRISFDIEKEYSIGDVKIYNFYQPPKGKSKQYCLVRTGNDISFNKYFGKIYTDFICVLEINKESLKQSYYNYLKKNILFLTESILFDENLNQIKKEYFDISIQEEINKENNKEKDVSIGIIKKYLINIGIIKTKSNISFFIPVIKINKKERNIVTKKAYRDFFKSTKQMILEDENERKSEYCYCCGNLKSNMIHDLSFRTFGAKISMIFTTTTINSASHIKSENYHRNYKICTDCKDIIVSGEQFIDKNLKFKLAGVDTYLIPFFFNIKSDFPYDEISFKIKNKIYDLVFKSETLKDFIDYTKHKIDKTENKEWNNNNFEITFLSFEGGNSFKMINIIQDISKFNFEKIIETFDIEHTKLINFIDSFNLNTIYSMIPVNENTKKNEVLELYSNIFKLNKINKKTLYEYFCKSINYLYYLKQDKVFTKADIYKNLSKDRANIFDDYIKEYVFKYLILINSLKELKLFYEEESEIFMEKDYQKSDYSDFLNEQKFNEQQRSLFFLGILLKIVAIKQRIKGHYTTPILQKIQFQGMTVKDIQRLYLDVIEKMRQYNIQEYKEANETVELLMKLYHSHFDKNISEWNLKDEENVFYLLSGYAYYDNK